MVMFYTYKLISLVLCDQPGMYIYIYIFTTNKGWSFLSIAGISAGEAASVEDP